MFFAKLIRCLLGKRLYKEYLLKKIMYEISKNNQKDWQTLYDYVQKYPINKKQNICETEFVAIDFETSGLNPKKHEIISYGIVGIRNLAIQVRTMRYKLIKPIKEIDKNSVKIHELTHDVLQNQGEDPTAVMLEILGLLAGKIAIVHFKDIEEKFIKNSIFDKFKILIDFAAVDTLHLEKRYLDATETMYQPNDLRLFNLRRAKNLNVANAHNALEDSIATAELFLMQVKRGKFVKLREIL